MLTSFQRKSRITKYSWDLPLENMICQYVLWTHVAYIAVRPKKKNQSGNQPGKKNLSLTCPHSPMCIRIYII